MKPSDQWLLHQNTSVNIEAPDSFLSGLLCVLSAEIISVNVGEVATLPAHKDAWYLLTTQEKRSIQYAGHETGLLEAPEAVILEADSSMTLTTKENALVLAVLLCGSTVSEICAEALRKGARHFHTGGKLMRSFYSMLSADGEAGHQVTAADASAMAYMLLMQLYQEGGSRPSAGQQFPSMVEEALRIMRKDYAYLEGIADLADQLGVTQEYLTRAFHRWVGMTPGHYLNDVRIAHAKHLLSRNEYSVAFIAEACGFTNSNYFSRVFRQRVGMTPKAYALSHKKQNASQADAENEDLPDEIWTM